MFKKLKAKRNTQAAMLKMIRDNNTATLLRLQYPESKVLYMDIPESPFWNPYEGKITGERRIVGRKTKKGEFHLFKYLTEEYPFLSLEDIQARSVEYDIELISDSIK